MRRTLVVIAMALALAGCANGRQDRVLGGAVIGGGTGALIGALLAARGWAVRGNIVYYGTLVLVLAAIFATGSRTPVYSLIAAIIVYAAGAAVAGGLIGAVAGAIIADATRPGWCYYWRNHRRHYVRC